MKEFYALFDQDNIDSWAWFDEVATPYETLWHFYTEYAVKHRHPSPNELTADDLWGGLVKYNDWLVVYRYFNGGNQQGGRPNRYVILTAWIKNTGSTDDSIDLLQILNSDIFQFVSKHAKDNPVPQPKETETAICDFPKFELQELSKLCHRVASDIDHVWLHAKIEYVGGRWAKIKPEGKQKPKPPQPKSPDTDSDTNKCLQSSINQLWWEREQFKSQCAILMDTEKKWRISNENLKRKADFYFSWAVSATVTTVAALLVTIAVMIIR